MRGQAVCGCVEPPITTGGLLGGTYLEVVVVGPEVVVEAWAVVVVVTEVVVVAWVVEVVEGEVDWG